MEAKTQQVESISKTNFDVYQMVTDKIISKLEKGQIPWNPEWSFRTPFTAAKNYITKKEYTGINFWMLAAEEYQQPYFLTYKQAKDLGGYIEKGAKSEIITYWNFTYVDPITGKNIPNSQKNSVNEDDVQKKGYLKYYRVFNVMYLKGVEIDLPIRKIFTEDEKELAADTIFLKCPSMPSIHDTHNKEAYYELTQDNLFIPNKVHFPSNELYYRTKFHELVHSTGHKNRLNRDMTGDHDTIEYAKEELIAELGSAYLSALVGYNDEYLDRSAQYLQYWLKALRNDKRFIVDAASKATKAVNYILGKNENETKEGDN